MSIKAEEHIFGKHRAHVVDNKDPDNRGRVRVVCPTLYPQRATALPTSSNWSDATFEYPIVGWCEPSMQYGQFTVPPLGAGVWIEFEAGHPMYPIYSGIWYSKVGGERPVPDFAVATLPNPTKRVWSSDKHRIVLDDTEDTESLLIHSFSGHEILLKDFPANEEQLSIVTQGGNSIVLSDKTGEEKVVITTQGGHTITLDDTSGSETIEILHSNGEYFKINKDGKISTNSNAPGSDDFFVLKKFITMYMDTHMHTGNLGAPTSPPILTSATFAGVGLATDKV